MRVHNCSANGRANCSREAVSCPDAAISRTVRARANLYDWTFRLRSTTPHQLLSALGPDPVNDGMVGCTEPPHVIPP